jgi:hypothetical protein
VGRAGASCVFVRALLRPRLTWRAQELLHFAAVVNLSVGVTAWFLM